MSKLYLARHGECDWSGKRVLGDADRPLTEQGLEEAWAVANELKAKRIDSIYSSLLLRAFMTAQIIAQHHNIEIAIVKEFKERCHGVLQGTLRDEIPDYLKIDNSYEKKFPGGESTKDVGARVIPKLQEILIKDHEKAILIVSHANVMKNIHHYLTNCSINEMVNFHFKRGEFYEYNLNGFK